MSEAKEQIQDLSFLQRHQEKGEFNQYWYSAHTTQMIIKELETAANSVAFLSTPSVYFSLGDSNLKEKGRLFEYDHAFSSDPGYVFYDFHSPENLPKSLLHTFDCVVIDPPFVTEDVWEKYAVTAKLLLSEGGRMILSSISENGDLLRHLLNAQPCEFLPSIPHLVYQYEFFSNYKTTYLCNTNPEILCARA